MRSSPHPLLPYSLPSSLPTPPPLLGALCCAVACALKRSAQSVCVCARARVYGMCAERFGSHARSPVRVCYPWVCVWVCGCLGRVRACLRMCYMSARKNARVGVVCVCACACARACGERFSTPPPGRRKGIFARPPPSRLGGGKRQANPTAHADGSGWVI